MALPLLVLNLKIYFPEIRNAFVPLRKGDMKHNFPQLCPTQLPCVLHSICAVWPSMNVTVKQLFTQGCQDSCKPEHLS